jgi:transglutaminase TgpA-like protein/transglutaminase superfamily protein
VTTTLPPRNAGPARPEPTRRPPAPPARPDRPPLPWAAAGAAGLAVLLAGAPVTAIVQGTVWPVQAAVAVVPVVAVGLALHRLGAAATVVGQVLTLLVLLTARFTDGGLLGFLPGPTALGEFGGLLQRAGEQIDTSTAPVLATTEIRFLVTAAFGLLAIGVFVAAVTAAAPAAAGVPLLAVFAVPAALADDLLPWWAMAAAAAGFGVLLVVGAGSGRRRSGTGVVVVVVSAVAALAVGAGASFVGTAGRFEGNGVGGGSTSSIGLSPFTALRGQLDQSTPVELFRVRGLERPVYLRALTLRQYVPGLGWQASAPAPGAVLPGAVPAETVTPGEVADVDIENVAFRDYWLPLYGEPLEVAGLPEGQWQYDTGTGTGYTVRPRSEDGWQQRALLPSPTADDLRAAQGVAGVSPEYLDARDVDPRVAGIAAQVTGTAGNAFDKALALQDYFTGPTAPFRYSLETAPGGGDDALVEFLTVGQTGYCEQFASAMATMLRTVGVPARVAVGFTGGAQVGDYRSITTQDAHAWVEAWFPGIGWTAFDPTPLTDGRAITPPYVEQARGESAGQDTSTEPDELSPEDDINPQDLPQPEALDPAATPPPPAVEQEAAGLGVPLWPFAVLLLVLAAAGTPAALRVHHRRRRLAAVTAGGPDAAGAAWAELLAESLDRDVAVPATDTVRGAARRLVREHRLDDGAQQALRAVVAAVENSWYGGGHPAPRELDGAVRTVAAGIAAGSGLTARQRMLPRSVLRRGAAAPAAEDKEPVGSSAG